MKLLIALVALTSLLVLVEARRNGVASIVAINPRETTNHVAHRTNLFKKDKDIPLVDGIFLFLRRGQSFEIELEVDKKLDDPKPVEVSAKYLFPTKKGRSKPAVTRVAQEGFSVKSATIHPGAPKFIYTVVVDIATNVPIGQYEVSFSLKNSKTENSVITKNILVLFNAWAAEDPVYMENEADRQEYVMNTEGLIWVGSSNDYSAAPWKYNQFNAINLETALVGLNAVPLSSPADYADPILVSRQLSFAAGDSICWGKWSGNYTHETNPKKCGYKCQPDQKFEGSEKKMKCTEPWHWDDVSTMLDYHRISANKRVQIQWCQCFVFAALINSLGRSLGLPTRAVTNFQSAADHNVNNKIEKFYTESKGYFTEAEDNPNADDPDSVWNFHVWNEGFFRRPAQKAKSGKLLNLDGWQAFDGTPQVASKSGRYEMGPASLAAVFRNQVDMDYDVKFVVSEVNANVSVNVKKPDGTWEERYNTEYDIFDPEATPGQKLSTKKPGQVDCSMLVGRKRVYDRRCENSRLDLTDLYKKKEWSGPSPAFEKRTIGDVEAKLVFPARDEIVKRGESVNYGYIFTNNGDDDVEIHVALKVDAIDYTDTKLFPISETRKVISIAPQTEYKLVKTMTQDHYDAIFDEETLMGAAYTEFTLSARVDNDGAVFFHKKLLQIHDDSRVPNMDEFFKDDEEQPQQAEEPSEASEEQPQQAEEPSEASEESKN